MPAMISSPAEITSSALPLSCTACPIACCSGSRPSAISAGASFHSTIVAMTATTPNFAIALASSTRLRIANMRLMPSMGFMRLNCGAIACVAKLQPPNASGAMSAASVIAPSTGMESQSPSAAACANAGSMNVASVASSRESARLRRIISAIWPVICPPSRYSAAPPTSVTAAALSSRERGI